MNLQTLANEYKKQADLIKHKLSRLNKEVKLMQGEELYRTRKKIYQLENMHMECMSAYNALVNYYDK